MRTSELDRRPSSRSTPYQRVSLRSGHLRLPVGRMPVPDTFAELQANACFMVYLPRLRWRADHSLRRLRDVGFDNLVLVEGVDADEVDPRAVGERQGLYFDSGLAPGQIATTLSMVGLWERVSTRACPTCSCRMTCSAPGHSATGASSRRNPARDRLRVFRQPADRRGPAGSKPASGGLALVVHARYLITQEGARRAWRCSANNSPASTAGCRRPIRRSGSGCKRERSDLLLERPMLPPPYPSSDGEGHRDGAGPDVIRASRSTGLFFRTSPLVPPYGPAASHTVVRTGAAEGRR